MDVSTTPEAPAEEKEDGASDVDATTTRYSGVMTRKAARLAGIEVKSLRIDEGSMLLDAILRRK